MIDITKKILLAIKSLNLSQSIRSNDTIPTALLSLLSIDKDILVDKFDKV